MSYNFVQVNEFTPAKGGWVGVGNIDAWSYDTKEKSILLTSQNNNVRVKIYILGPSAYRVRFNPTPNHDYDQDHNNSYAVVNRNLGDTKFNLVPDQVNGAKVLRVELEKITLIIGLEPYGIAVYRGSQVVHQDTYGYNLVYTSLGATACFKSIIPGAGYYGFGEKGGINLDNNKHTLTFFNYDNFEYSGSNVSNGPDNIYQPVIPDHNQPGPLNVSEPLYNSMPILVEWNPNPPQTGYFAGTPYACAIFLDNPGQTFFNIQTNADMDNRYYFGALYEEMDYYVMIGDDIPSVLKQYNILAGSAAMPPMYALGYHQGGYGYYDKNRLMEVAQNYRNAKIPIDGLHIDVDFQNNYRTFTVSNLKFPDVDKMFDELHKEGFKCSTNITGIVDSNPYDENNQEVSNPYLDSGYANDVFITREFEGDMSDLEQQATQKFEKAQNGELEKPEKYLVVNENYGSNPVNNNGQHFNPYPSPNPPFDPTCPPGAIPLGTYGHYPDIGREDVQKWWGEQYYDLLNKGLDMIWQDMTDPATVRSCDSYAPYKTLPLNVKMTDWRDGQKKANAKIHNAFAISLIQATYEGLTKIKQSLPDGHYNKNKRNFIIARGGYAGVHRYAANWTGDSASSWDFLQINIPEVLNWGMSGQALSGCDIGGFGNGSDDPYNSTVVSSGKIEGGQISRELLARWMTMGAFLPWYRNHYNGYTKAYQEPYNYDSYVIDACRKYIEIRYKLLQLFYDAMYEYTQTGMPICRALFLNDPQDQNLYKDPFVKYRLSDQFFVGRDLLIAPMVYQNTQERDVYLPAGSNWYVYTDNTKPVKEPTAGGQSYHWYNITLDVVPIYVREGAIIPVRELEQWVGQLNSQGKPNPITYSIYPGKSAYPDINNSYVCYEDDGISTAAAGNEKVYRITKIAHQDGINGKTITVLREHDIYKPQLENFYYVSLLGSYSSPTSVTVNGNTIGQVKVGDDKQNADALSDSKYNAYYYSLSLQTTFIKIFDDKPSETVIINVQ